MEEALLQFIWQYSLYNTRNLITTSGESVRIIQAGKKNIHAGPDFETAKIRIDNTILVGNIEIHTRSSDWFKHGHASDSGYRNIILHVVYEDDCREPINGFPCLVLKPHIPQYISGHYAKLIFQKHPIPCHKQLLKVPSLARSYWLNSMVSKKWASRLQEWEHQLRLAQGNWLELFYWKLASNFGFKTNAAPFHLLARSIPLKTILKISHDSFRIEAILFGQAGFLENRFQDDYPRQLQKEYRFMRKAYRLPPCLPLHIWKFSKMRPANFPTIRLAQFADFLHRSAANLARLIDIQEIGFIQANLGATAGAYWNDHYHFDKPSKDQQIKLLGSESIDRIIINTIAPFQFLYYHHQNHKSGQQNAIDLLSQLRPERNAISDLWKQTGWIGRNAAETQGMIHLYESLCSSSKCIHCAIGVFLMNQNHSSSTAPS